MDMELKVAARVLMVVVSHLPEVKASPYSAERRRRERVIRYTPSKKLLNGALESQRSQLSSPTNSRVRRRLREQAALAQAQQLGSFLSDFWEASW